MLELIQQKYFTILIGGGRNNFIIEWNENHEGQENVKTDEEPGQEPDLEGGLAQ